MKFFLYFLSVIIIIYFNGTLKAEQLKSPIILTSKNFIGKTEYQNFQNRTENPEIISNVATASAPEYSYKNMRISTEVTFQEIKEFLQQQTLLLGILLMMLLNFLVISF